MRMKSIKILLTPIIVTIFVLMVNAEYTYKPMIEDGKKWIIGHFEFLPVVEPVSTFTLEVGGDTIINGQSAKIIMSGSSCFASYEENGIIYDNAYTGPWDRESFLPLLNFNVHVGDTIEAFVIASEEILTIRGIERRVLWLKDNDSFDWLNYNKSGQLKSELGVRPGRYWIEGIGSSYDYYLSDYTRPTSFTSPMLWECYKDEELIYKAGDIEEILGIYNPRITDNLRQDATVYNLMGQQVDKPHKGQIYIRAGKKIVW